MVETRCQQASTRIQRGHKFLAGSRHQSVKRGHLELDGEEATVVDLHLAYDAEAGTVTGSRLGEGVV